MLEICEYYCDLGHFKLGIRQPAISKKPFLVCRILCTYEDFEGNYTTKKNSF